MMTFKVFSSFTFKIFGPIFYKNDEIDALHDTS